MPKSKSTAVKAAASKDTPPSETARHPAEPAFPAGIYRRPIDPPRKNRKLLILTSCMLLAWLVFLAYLAMYT